MAKYTDIDLIRAKTGGRELDLTNANLTYGGRELIHKDDLASTDSGKGSSLVGIHDVNGRFTATTLEGALDEVKAIADANAAGVGASWSMAVLHVTTTELGAYTEAGSGIGKTITADSNGAFSLQSYTATLNMRVLVSDDTDGVGDAAAVHGIYDLTTIGDGSNPFVLTRATDADEDDDFTPNKTIAISDGTSAGSTYKMVTTESHTVDTTALAFNLVSTSSLADGSVSTAKLSTDAVTGDKLADNSVNTEHIVADAVDGTKIADDSIDTEHISDNAVENAALSTALQAKMTKIDGIETGATADQTGAEIKAAYEAEADTNAYDDAAVSKLAGIEDNATADQTGAEIKAAYEGEADTNAFTDAEQTKLSGVEANATADQTDAEIKTAYENNADTNAFTDADHSKLDGIEAGATATTGGDGIVVTGSSAAVNLASLSDGQDVMTLASVGEGFDHDYDIIKYAGSVQRIMISKSSGYTYTLRGTIEDKAQITLSGMTDSNFNGTYDIVRYNTNALSTSDDLTFTSSTSHSNPSFPMTYYNRTTQKLLAYDTTNDVWKAFDLSDATVSTGFQNVLDGKASSYTSSTFTLSGTGQSESLGSGDNVDFTNEIYDIPADTITQVSYTGSGDVPYAGYIYNGGEHMVLWHDQEDRWVAVAPTSTVDYTTVDVTDDTNFSVSGSSTNESLGFSTTDYDDKYEVHATSSARIPNDANISDISYADDTPASNLAVTDGQLHIDSAFATKVGHISVTQAVNLDNIESDVDTAKTDITAIESKTDFISVTQAVDLDTIESDVSTLNTEMGDLPASPTNYTPSSNTVQAHLEAIDGEIGGSNKVFIADFDYQDTTVQIVSNAPSGSSIMEIMVRIDTAFDGTTPTISVGTASSSNTEILGTSSIDLTDANNNPQVGYVWYVMTTTEDVNAYITVSGATQGAGRIAVRRVK